LVNGKLLSISVDPEKPHIAKVTSNLPHADGMGLILEQQRRRARLQSARGANIAAAPAAQGTA
jgi:hypothetical protein